MSIFRRSTCLGMFALDEDVPSLDDDDSTTSSSNEKIHPVRTYHVGDIQCVFIADLRCCCHPPPLWLWLSWMAMWRASTPISMPMCRPPIRLSAPSVARSSNGCFLMKTFDKQNRSEA
jgi:hypothetical protein